MVSLEGKVALVTGAGSKRGMGHAIAVRLAREKAHVVAVDRELAPKSIWPGDENWGGLTEVLSEIRAAGTDGLSIVADISNRQDVDNTIAQTLEKFGKIDIFVQCVGIRGPVSTPIMELDEKVWRQLLDVNLTGVFLISKAVAKTMIPDGEGKKMVFISSLAGSRGHAGSGGYCASKHGVIGLAKTLALELAKYKINVNIISPGVFSGTNLRDESIAEAAKAEGLSVAEFLSKRAQGGGGPGMMIPLGRSGTMEDITNLVTFLVSDQSSYFTGEDFRICGGLGVS
ncbi:MAG: SDR family oxidoreductase [Deltaproteobacteria bacterium]|nr:MAG: SDR family oxidoreductase [Deltaproteobacteria bacterium]